MHTKLPSFAKEPFWDVETILSAASKRLFRKPEMPMPNGYMDVRSLRGEEKEFARIIKKGGKPYWFAALTRILLNRQERYFTATFLPFMM